MDELASFLIFAQQDAPYLDLAALARQARRFFDASVEARGGATPSERYAIASHLSVVPDAGHGGVRRVFARMAKDADWIAADEVEARVGYTGLALLARRCHVVWIIEAEGPEDPVALRIAATLASLLLGPILAPAQTELFGVRTARIKLERALPKRP